MTTRDIPSLTAEVKEASTWIHLLKNEMSRVIIGQEHLVNCLLVGLLSNGHILLEGVPGLAKTLSIKTLAEAAQASFSRIQFTPDLLPSDILGTLIYNPKEADFQTKKGPIFANLVLADEINRAPAKVQSALLEAMQERQVTIGNETFKLPEPFLVLATQNPIDQAGTYTLPEAQVDRFMLKVHINYPTASEELAILNSMARIAPKTHINTIITPRVLEQSKAIMDAIYIDEKVRQYIVSLVLATRKNSQTASGIENYIRYGASPRATIALGLAGKAWAFLQGRGFVTPADIKSIAKEVLRHRILLSYEAQAEDITADSLIATLLETIVVP